MRSRLLFKFLFGLLGLLPLLGFAETVTVLPSLPAKTIQQMYNSQGGQIAGNPQGSITLVEFFDYNCAYCRKLQPTIRQLIQHNPQLRVVYKEILLFGDASLPPTTAAFAASRQGRYLSLHDAMLKAKRPLQSDELLRLAKQVGLDVAQFQADQSTQQAIQITAANMALFKSLGIEGTPAFVVANSAILNTKTNSSIPQYKFEGSDDAAQQLQSMIRRASRLQ